MKRWMIGVCLAVAALPAAASELSLRGLLQAAQANQNPVVIEHEKGEDWVGSITELGVDVFCVTPAPRGRKKEAQDARCYPYSVITAVQRPVQVEPGDILTIWVSGSSVQIPGLGI